MPSVTEGPVWDDIPIVAPAFAPAAPPGSRRPRAARSSHPAAPPPGSGRVARDDRRADDRPLPRSARTLIVGSGVAGLSLAVALARLGDDVVVIERDGPAAGATGRNAGFLLCDSECMGLAAAMHGRPVADALHAAGLATRAFVRGLEDATFGVDWSGSLRLATDRAEARRFAETVAMGLPGVRLVDVAGAPESGHVPEIGRASEFGELPETGAAPFLAALADDGDGQVHPLALVARLLAEADRLGVRREDGTPVLELRPAAGRAGSGARRTPVAPGAPARPGSSGGPRLEASESGPGSSSGAGSGSSSGSTAGSHAGVRSSSAAARGPGAAPRGASPPRAGIDVLTTRGTIRADRVVVCTNSDAQRLVPGAVAVRPVRAQALAAWIDPPVAWTRPTYATRGGDYWRRLPDGRVLLGGMRRVDRRAENTRAPGPSTPVQGALDELLRRLVGPGRRIVVTHRWSGTMAFTRDGVPYVGAVPLGGPRRAHVLAGFNGHGMGWAPGLATLLAASLQGAGPPPPTIYRPGRNLGAPSGPS